ncbi:MAG: ATP-binding protein [Kofleriaceae bacterium]
MPSPPAPVRPDAERLALMLDITERLHRLTAHLSLALTIEDVAAIVVDEGTNAMGAATGAMWLVDEPTNTLRLLRSVNYPAAALASVKNIPITPAIPVSDAVVRGEPVWLSSRADYAARYPESAARTRELQDSGYSVAALPIRIDDRTRGVLVLTFLAERGFDLDERKFLGFLAMHCAQGFERARLHALAVRAQERSQFLAKASALLGSSLDYEETLRNVASLAVPGIGDWCAVDLLDEKGAIKQVAVAHVDPAKVDLAHELRRRYPPDPESPRGVPSVLRTGASQFVPEITDEMLVAGARDEEHLRISRALGLRSGMVVAIRDRVSVIGAITFVLASGERYTNDDLLMAEQLGERAGAAIANAKLYTAARDAIRVRDEFMLVAGHELRTPLAALGLLHESLEKVRDGTPIEKIRERGGKLRAQTQRLGRLVEDLLDVSRMSAGRLTLEPERFDLAALVGDIGERMREELERSHSPLTTQLEPVEGHWDRARIDQVVTNLLGNAAKYGRGSPIEARVRRDGDRAILTVVDQGIGIAVEDQPRIFKRFERAAPSRKYSGLGLGLWITSELVHAHGGEIAVESEPGKGATFTVRLPITRP